MAVAAMVSACSRVPIKTRRGVYHTVGAGETLWRICHVYQVNMVTVCRFNGIEEAEKIQTGQRLFIPGATRVRKVQPVQAQGGDEGASAGGSPTAAKESADFQWPVKGMVTRWFGVKAGRRHDGIDIAAAKGTPILAAQKGKVIYSDDGIPGYGNLIIIQHNNGYSTVYAHNARNQVEVGEVVERRQHIGDVGSTGRSTGSHLHFEIRKGVRPVDPLKLLR